MWYKTRVCLVTCIKGALFHFDSIWCLMCCALTTLLYFKNIIVSEQHVLVIMSFCVMKSSSGSRKQSTSWETSLLSQPITKKSWIWKNINVSAIEQLHLINPSPLSVEGLDGQSHWWSDEFYSWTWMHHFNAFSYYSIHIHIISTYFC